MIRPPVLCYHRIGGPLELGITRVSQKVFARHMTTLAKHGWRTISIEQFQQATSRYLFPLSRLSSDGKDFLLTFDDGHASLAEFAYPVLADLGFTATTFLVTDYVGHVNSWDVPYAFRRFPQLSWRTIEAWRSKGFDFGSHSGTHRRLTWLRNETISDELTRSRQALVERLGAAAGVAIAYPFGAASDRTVELARQVGFGLGFAGAWEKGTDPLRLARVPIYVWDALPRPFALWVGPIGTVGRFTAHLANRCALGTTLALALAGRYRSSWRPFHNGSAPASD
ncbi:MAG TPA: polysaccharide deacetylase family protein [Gemmatimonadales bacterium]|nr:polysaccharide deacetylase family protein [Gemmatimonadales bacterium]